MKTEFAIRIQLTTVDDADTRIVGDVKLTATDDVSGADQEANATRLAENMVREAFQRLRSRISSKNMIDV